MRTIQYGIDEETGLVWSRCGDKVAIPILDYAEMLHGCYFKIHYFFETHSAFSVPQCTIKWTRKIDRRIKNLHREFWGFKPLR